MRKTTTLVLALVLGACGQAAHEARPESDRARDANRKPADVLEFIGIKPGMIVLDMFSGGGYYTEILSYVVGENGHVVAQSNEAYLGFAGEEFEQRNRADDYDKVVFDPELRGKTDRFVMRFRKPE